MSAPKPTIDDSVLADDLARIVAACGRFEADWNAGRPRRIEDELAAAPEHVRSRLFRELLALEFELCRRDGRNSGLGAYIARFPDQADVVRERVRRARLSPCQTGNALAAAMRSS